MRDNPSITISFATRIGQFDFRAENIDAAIHVGRPDWPDADCRFLMNETVVAVCTPEFLMGYPITGAEELLGLPLLDMASRPGAWRHWFGSLGITDHRPEGMMFEQFSNVTQACLAGLGVALMPEFLIGTELGSGRLVRAVDWSVESESAYYLVRPRHKLDFPPARIFADWLFREGRGIQGRSKLDPWMVVDQISSIGSTREIELGKLAHPSFRATSVITSNAAKASSRFISNCPAWKRMAICPSTRVCVR